MKIDFKLIAVIVSIILVAVIVGYTIGYFAGAMSGTETMKLALYFLVEQFHNNTGNYTIYVDSSDKVHMLYTPDDNMTATLEQRRADLASFYNEHNYTLVDNESLAGNNSIYYPSMFTPINATREIGVYERLNMSTVHQYSIGYYDIPFTSYRIGWSGVRVGEWGDIIDDSL